MILGCHTTGRPRPTSPHTSMPRKPKKGYFVSGHFVAEGSELDLELKRELDEILEGLARGGADTLHGSSRVLFQATQRAANFAISNPARELLFTVVEREEKYKAKYVIDNVVFRGGDAASGWLFHALRGFGMELSAISLATVPVALGWLALALALGRAHEQRAPKETSEQ